MDIHWVDVFATAPLSGNPLAVITAPAMPGDGAMQRLAAELGLSETVFAVPGDPPRLRIFTPEAEIPLAGHPLVGAAWVLRRIGWVGSEAMLSTPAGDIPVQADDHGAAMTRTGPVSPGHADTGAVAECLGGRAVGDAPIWDAGLPQVMLEVADLDGLSPDHDALRLQARAEGWAGVSAYVVRGRDTGAVEAEVRHFASPIGIPEDPVTGSAAGALGAALAARGDSDGRGGLRLVVRQGRHLGRDGLVQVDVAGGPGGPTAVTIGGAVVPVMAGIISEGILPG